MNFYRVIGRRLNLPRHGINLIIKRRTEVHCVEAWRCKVPPLYEMEGTLAVRSKYSVNIEPLPLDKNSFDEYDNCEKVLVSLLVNTDSEELKWTTMKNWRQYLECDSHIESHEHGKFCKVCVNLFGKMSDVSPKDISLAVRVPYHFSVKVNSEEHADVCIRGLEGKAYEVSATGSGNCNLKSLKGQSVNCATVKGDISCDSYLLSKNGSLVSKKGNIYINKLQGGNFYLRTEQDKELTVKATYLEKVKMESQLGDIKLGDIHGSKELNIAVEFKPTSSAIRPNEKNMWGSGSMGKELGFSEVVTDRGNIKIGSVKGNLQAATKTGNIDAFIAEHKNVELTTDKGDILIRMGNSVSSDLIIEAEDIHVDSALRLENECSEESNVLNGNHSINRMTAQITVADGDSQPRLVKAKARLGQVKIEKMDWFTSLKLSL